MSHNLSSKDSLAELCLSWELPTQVLLGGFLETSRAAPLNRNLPMLSDAAKNSTLHPKL